MRPLIPELQKVFDKAVVPKDLRQVIDDVDKGNPQPQQATPPSLCDVLWPFVAFQAGAYSQKGLSLSQEGFQVGGPWVGEIGKEKILFLSSNPGFTSDHCNPRYMYNTDDLRFQGEVMDKSDLLTYLEKPLNYIQIQNKQYKLMHFKNVNSTKPLLSIQTNLKLKEVRYWNDLVYRFLAKVYLDGNTDFDGINQRFAGQLSIADKIKYIKYLVKKAVFTEIIPFGSNGQVGVNDDSLQFCWDNYSSHILDFSAAGIWVIVGAAARNQFLKIIQNLPINQIQPFQLDNCYLGNFGPGNRSRLILTVTHPNARPNGCFQNSICNLFGNPGIRQEINNRK
ncbi:MAG: hypothetical protein LBK91_06560 [Synergistaceae bacterium]|jgi:hypothetical protein|nr:hypothetical protein [Synergistaceae bacterium]